MKDQFTQKSGRPRQPPYTTRSQVGLGYRNDLAPSIYNRTYPSTTTNEV
ncbi:hypothetical protein POX_e06293 [Penicillium oxalicum]|nr:hypothetical protein POX_e06293 [Penicillium oxalicum]KAI2788280.1 hypothetical protein POX_e06293 [Penicillium oxalicum]